MSSSPLQRIADSLGSRLQRAVAIDDPRMHLQVYSPHYGAVDDTRLGSILHREAPPESVAWVMSRGIAQAQAPMRLPANPDLQLLPRIAAPIRCQDVLLGYLWLIDAEESLTDQELDEVAAAAEKAGPIMYREQLLNELERGRERELLRDLLGDDATIRQDAARTLVEAEMLPRTGAVSVLTVHPTGYSAGDEDRVRIAIDIALSHTRLHTSARCSLQLSRPDHGVFLVASGDPALHSGGVVGLGKRMQETLLSNLGDSITCDAVVGIGDRAADVADAAIAYRQAKQAAHIARIVPVFGSVASWSQLGIYRVLAQLPAEELSEHALHPGLAELLSEASHDTLVHTLECYLDNAGDAKETAAELVVHRTSLYYRLGRIEQVAGVSLRNGDDRLALHLGLKMARLAGLYPRPAGRSRPARRQLADL